MVQRTCTLPECGNKHRARGLCSTHYNQQHSTPEQRHPKQIVQCTWCKTDCIKDSGRERRYGGLFCSLTCRDQWRKATGNNPVPSPEAQAKAKAALHAKSRATAIRKKRTRVQARAVRKLQQAGQGTRGVVWISGACAHCRDQFTTKARSHDMPRYCSDRCANRAAGARRWQCERRAVIKRYSRVEIFERDGWRCHLCQRPVDRTATVPALLAPTIDHLLPLSKGGADAPDNVATAHFQCNSIKGARTDYASYQLAFVSPLVTIGNRIR